MASDLAIKKPLHRESFADTGGNTFSLQGIRDAFKNWWLVVRCSAIRVYVGMIPGLGRAVVDGLPMVTLSNRQKTTDLWQG